MIKLTTLVALLISIVTMPAFAAKGDVVLNSVVAVVNDGVVLATEVAAETSYLKKQAQSSGQALPSDEVFKKRVLERLIDQEIQSQHASKLGISIDPGSINQAIAQIAGNNNMDTAQFRQSMKAEGFDYDRFRVNVKQELLFGQLQQREVFPRIKVSSQELDDYIKANTDSNTQQFNIQHILLAVPPTANTDDYNKAKAKADEVLARLRDGADFAQTATASSDGAKALDGGDLGWRTLQEVPDFLANALSNMKPGDISEPLRSNNGLHIVRLNDVRSGSQSKQTETLARHIYLANSQSDNPKGTLATIRKRINAGESFEALAKEFSQDPNSASKGGELPWFGANQMPKEIEQTAAALTKGELSQPFKTQFGWHLLEVLDTRANNINQDKLKQQAEQIIRRQKAEQETQRWIRQLRDESFIEMRS